MLPWTKFQDFYLRLGFLKALASVLDVQRRSAQSEAIVRRLQKPLFDSAATYPALWRRAEPLVTWYPRKTTLGRVITHPEVAEALLAVNDAESMLYGITHDTAYKIVDWGRDVAFLGRGNQITERAIVLRHLLDQPKAEAFFQGDVFAWDPFGLSLREKLFFLFHLHEIDQVTVEIALALGKQPAEHALESNDAAQMTCRALIEVLRSVEDSVSPLDIPAYRIARELAATIAEELGLQSLLVDDSWQRKARAPRPVKPASRRSAFSSGRSAASPRRTTKNADHQTIPRFEQLVDLGFLSKPAERDDPRNRLDSRRRWRYVPTETCRRWKHAREALGSQSTSFRWNGFAATSVSAFHGTDAAPRATPSVNVVARYLWEAYTVVRRWVGQTPLDSVALFAMISAAADGIAIEMTDFHGLLLNVKQTGLLPEHAFFASGNDLDKMFIQLKPGFLERIESVGHELGTGVRQ